MKTQLLEELTLLHFKVADLKVYDAANAALLRQYAQQFEALLTRLLTFSTEKFKDISSEYLKTSSQNSGKVLDVHDDTDNDAGFYDSVSYLNNSINDSIEIMNAAD